MLNWEETFARLLMAAIFGALVGLERERKNWSAGLRTHMLVCVGACLMMIVSSFGFADVLGKPNITLDPSRVAAQVVSGIGFIGAGTILFQKQGTIRGLTTAAGLWTVAGIGLAAGGGMYLAAAMATFLAILILWALQPLEKKYAQRFVHQMLKIVTFPEPKEIEEINNLLNNSDLNVVNFNLTKSKKSFVFEIKFEEVDTNEITQLTEQIRNLNSVKKVVWSR